MNSFRTALWIGDGGLLKASVQDALFGTWSSWKRLGICYCYRALINSVSMVSCDADRSLILVMIMYTSVSHGYERGPGSRASCYLGPAAHELRHIPYH